MRLRVDDPAFLPPLIAFLQSRLDIVIGVQSRSEVELSLLGSYGLASARDTVALVIAAWEETERSRRGSVVVLS